MYRAAKLGVIALRIVSFSALGFVAVAGAQTNKKDVVAFDIPALTALSRHSDMLADPGILVVALENVGVQPTNSGRIAVRDRQTLEFQNSILRFTDRKGSVFHYDAKVALSLGIGEAAIRLPVELDATRIDQGHIDARVHLAFAKVIPVELTSRIELKIQSLATAQVQERLVAYLDQVTQRAGETRESVFERILIDYHNRALTVGAPGSREPGDAEPLSDQVLLFITLIIWVVIVPAAFISRRLWRKRKMRRA
jgi:hypothetical protein